MKRILVLLVLLSNLGLMAGDDLLPEIVTSPELVDLANDLAQDLAIIESEVGEYDFPKAEYENYMSVIQEINPLAYERLRKCEAASGSACINKAVTMDPTVEGPSLWTACHPSLVINSMNYLSREDLTLSLESWANLYNSIWDIYPEKPSITQAERNQILEILNTMVPELYSNILSVDPDGSKHIKRHCGNGASCTMSMEDGLPLFSIDEEFISLPDDQKFFVIGHELGHYVLGDLEPKVATALGHLSNSADPANITNTFKKAYGRTKESAADRFSILEMGATPDGGVAYFSREQAEPDETRTFQRTHPLDSARIQELKQLKYDLEMGNLKVRKPNINWWSLATNYLKLWANN